MALRRRTRWALAVGGVLVATALGLSLHGGWRPFGDDAGVLAAVPGDVDAACRVDVAALRASPLLAEPAVSMAIADALDREGTDVTDPMLGDDVALATRDGSWLLVLRASGFVHGVRLGVARLAVTTRGDGPVALATTPSDDDVYVARLGRVWIVSDDEELAEESLACISGTNARIAARLDLGGVFDRPSTVAAWVSDDAASHAIDVLRRVLGDTAAGIVASLPSPDSAFTLTLDTPAASPRCDAALAWKGDADTEARVTISADLVGVASAIEKDADSAPPPPPRSEPSDRVRFTIEASAEGLSGEELRAEVAKRVAAKAASRVVSDADAARTAAHRKANLLRALGHLDSTLTVHEGAARLTLTVMR